MDHINRTLTAGFRPVNDVRDLLTATIMRAAQSADFTDQGGLSDVLSRLSPALRSLIAAGLLEQVEVALDDLPLRINLVPATAPDAEDDLEVGYLGLLVSNADALTLQLRVSDMDLAQSLGAAEATACSTSTITVSVVPLVDVPPPPPPAPVDAGAADLGRS